MFEPKMAGSVSTVRQRHRIKAVNVELLELGGRTEILLISVPEDSNIAANKETNWFVNGLIL